MDGEFERVKPFLPTLECNTTAAKEHVSEAERTIRTLKERTRGLIATLPFTHIPRRMKIEFVYFVVLWLNAFPVKSGVSATYSPRELVLHRKLDYKKHCQVLPGSYCEVHDEPVPINTMVARTHACIALGPTGNLQGTVKFYCLTTGQVLKRRSFTVIPMPDRIITRVNKIGKREDKAGISVLSTDGGNHILGRTRFLRTTLSFRDYLKKKRLFIQTLPPSFQEWSSKPSKRT